VTLASRVTMHENALHMITSSRNIVKENFISKTDKEKTPRL